MNPQLQVKIGLLSLLSPELDQVWGTTMRSRAEERLASASNLLQTLGCRVISPEKPTTSIEIAIEHGKLLRENDVHVLVLYVGMWSYGSTAVAAAMECGVPTVIWTDTDIQYVGIVGASVCRGSLEEAGLVTSLVYGEMDDPAVLERLSACCLGAAAGTRLRNQIYGLMGSRSLGMYTSAIDPNGWRRQFGIEVESWDQLEVVERAKRISDKELAPHLAWTQATFGAIKVKEEVIKSAIKLYIVSKQIVAERSFDFVSVRCLPEMPVAFTTFCYAIALLNDSRDAEGEKEIVCCSCESDSNGALSMQILKHLAATPVLMADVRTVRLAEGEVWISNCGSSATDLATSPEDVHWVEHGFQEFEWKIGGAAPQYVCKSGDVTLARLTRVAGDYVMLISSGTAQAYPREKLKKTYWDFSPHGFIQLNGDPREFAQELRCNHLHMVYGNYVDHLKEFCRIFDIRAIVK